MLMMLASMRQLHRLRTFQSQLKTLDDLPPSTYLMFYL